MTSRTCSTAPICRRTPMSPFGYAAYLAKLTKADLHLIHVLEPLSDDAVFTFQAYRPGRRRSGTRSSTSGFEKARARDGRATGQPSGPQQSAEDQKVRAQIKSVTVCEAYPAEEILKAAKQHNCDLIVMGSHEGA